MRPPKRSPTRNPRFLLPAGGSPLYTVCRRLLLVLALIGVVMLVFWLDRENLRDASDGHVSFVDIVYFTMVTVTTVGYGDIVPVGDRARLLDAFLVTPIRLLIWALFIGTTYQLVLQHVVEEWRARRFGARMKNHIVVIGFGYEGSMAVRETIARGHPAGGIVVVDVNERRVHDASQLGCVGVWGDATKEEVVRLARVETAQAVLVCLPRDDSVALCTLSVRNLGCTSRLIASAREQENIHLLRQAGADEVVAPAKLAGYLMADAVVTPLGLRFVTDLLTTRGVISMVERAVTPAEIGLRFRDVQDHLVVGVQRNGKTIGFWDSADEKIQIGDRLFAIHGVPSSTLAENGQK